MLPPIQSYLFFSTQPQHPSYVRYSCTSPSRYSRRRPHRGFFDSRRRPYPQPSPRAPRGERRPPPSNMLPPQRQEEFAAAPRDRRPPSALDRCPHGEGKCRRRSRAPWPPRLTLRHLHHGDRHGGTHCRHGDRR